MASITYSYTFSNGTVADAMQINANFNNITAQVNGNLDNSNIAAAAAIAQTKIAGDAVDPTVALPANNNATTDLKTRINQILHQLKAIINVSGGDWYTAVPVGKSLTELYTTMTTFAVPVAIGSANAEGAAATYSRSDHVHQGVAKGIFGPCLFMEWGGWSTTGTTNSATPSSFWLFDPAQYPSATYYFEAVVGSGNALATATASLINVTDSLTIGTVSTTGGATRLRSAALTMPTAAKTLGVAVNTSDSAYTAILYSARLIIDIN
ncbi:MAG: hypothetical protein AB1760_00345 [Pseudomonadota bacterium]